MVHKSAIPCLLVILAVCSGIRGHRSISDLLEQSFAKYYEKGVISPVLRNVVTEIDLPNMLDRTTKDVSQTRVSLVCTTCAAGVNQILSKISQPDVDVDEAFDTAIQLCIDLGLGNDIFCSGYIKQAQPELIYIFSQTPNNTGNDICGTLFVGLGCESRDPQRDWQIELINSTKPQIDTTPYPAVADVPTMKVLHLADSHYDNMYTAGANAICDEIYLCCQNTSTGVRVPGDEAGYWGDYRNCDIPVRLLEVQYKHAAETHPDVDFIIWMGDHIPHNVWSNTKAGNIDMITANLDLIEYYFPGVPIFPAVGNHEAHPLNTFAQPYIDDPEFSISWLYDELAQLWTRWLPEEAAQQIAYGGSYSAPIRSGLRAVSVNSNYCYGLNWWLLLDSNDVAQELSHMMTELQAAEDAGEKVYLITHMSPGNQACHYTWSHEFNKIVSRYENTVVAILHGHTHKDHFEVYFDPENPDRAYKVSVIAPSQTTYTNLNPGYQIHIIEGDFPETQYRILDHEVYVMDLELANSQNDTSMYLLYSALESYGMTDLSPESYTDLVYRMNIENSTVFDTFYRNYVKDARPLLEEGCTGDCKSNILCRLLISDNSDHSHCDSLE